MYEENRILSKIEELVEKLPYQMVEITITLPNKTLTLQKDQRRPIGFQTGSPAATEKSNKTR